MSDKWLELGNLIRKRRLEKNLSIRDVKNIYNFDAGYLSKIENGKRENINVETLKLIAKILDISYIELYKIVGYIDDEAISEYINKKDSV